MEQNGFFIGAIVYLNNEYGIVVESTDGWNEPGLIRWDTNREIDIEDWRGNFGTFITNGGQIVENDYSLLFVNKDGSLK